MRNAALARLSGIAGKMEGGKIGCGIADFRHATSPSSPQSTQSRILVCIRFYFLPLTPPPFFFGATPSIFICGTAFLLAAKTTNAPDATVGNQLLLALSALTHHLAFSGWIGYYVATSLHPLGLWPPHPSTRSNKQAGNKRSSLSREIKLNSTLGAAAMCKTTDGRSTKWVD